MKNRIPWNKGLKKDETCKGPISKENLKNQ